MNMPEQETTGTTTTTDTTTEGAAGPAIDQTTQQETTTHAMTDTQEVFLSRDQYEELVSVGHDNMMIQNALLTVLIGLLIGYIAIKGLFDAWKT